MVSPVYENNELIILTKQRRDSSINELVFLKPQPQPQTHLNLTNNLDSTLTLPPDPEDTIPIPHHGRVTEVFNALRYVLLIMGRFPFSPTVNLGHFKNDWTRCETEKYKGTNYSSTIKSISWLYFGVTSIGLVVMLVISIGSFLGVFLSWSFFLIPPWTSNQINLFKSNLIPFVLVWSCLLSSTVGNISFVLYRKNVAKFLNYWNVAVDKMEVRVPKSLKTFLHVSNLWFMGFIIITIVCTKFLSIKLARGGTTLMGFLALRGVIEGIDDLDYWIFPAFGIFIILYAMYASRAMLFFFVFKCKLLRHCFKEWNSQLNSELKEPKRVGREGMQIEEATCRKLFHNHVILLRLIRLTDKVFSGTLLSYYGSQILNMCFELYYVAMSNRSTLFNSDGDGLDTFVAIVLLVQNIYMFLSVSLHAAYVGEEANKGYEIVKRKGFNVHDGPYRRRLIQSLQLSYQQRICLTGGHYFVIDKPFIVTVLGAVFTYFIIIIQYGQQPTQL